MSVVKFLQRQLLLDLHMDDLKRSRELKLLHFGQTYMLKLINPIKCTVVRIIKWLKIPIEDHKELSLQ